MLTQATQAAIAILHDISTGIYFRSANFRFTEEEWENLFQIRGRTYYTIVTEL